MACDIRLASEGSVFTQAEINLGIITGGGGSQRKPRLVGLGAAFKLYLTGERIDAKEALRPGLVDEVAEMISSKSAVATKFMKTAVKTSIRMPFDKGLHYEQALFPFVIASEDKDEGVRTFLEKHAAVWKDR